jgi:hypothetical protein
LLAEAGYADELQPVLDVPTILPDEAPYLARRMAEQYAKVGIVIEIREFRSYTPSTQFLVDAGWVAKGRMSTPLVQMPAESKRLITSYSPKLK